MLECIFSNMKYLLAHTCSTSSSNSNDIYQPQSENTNMDNTAEGVFKPMTHADIRFDVTSTPQLLNNYLHGGVIQSGDTMRHLIRLSIFSSIGNSHTCLLACPSPFIPPSLPFHGFVGCFSLCLDYVFVYLLFRLMNFHNFLTRLYRRKAVTSVCLVQNVIMLRRLFHQLSGMRAYADRVVKGNIR